MVLRFDTNLSPQVQESREFVFLHIAIVLLRSASFFVFGLH